MSSALEDAATLRDAGRYADAEAVLRARLSEAPPGHAVQAALNRILLLQGRAVPPADIEGIVALAQTLAALQGPAVLQGADEGPRLQQAAELILGETSRLPAAAKPTAARILWRTGHYEAAAALGGLEAMGRYCAQHDAPSELLRLLARVESDADRREALYQHQLWGQTLERGPARNPISRPARRAPRERLRLGFLSSDLRHHVVAFFAQPLFQHLDPRFELYCYSSFPGAADVVQPWFEARATAYRRLPADDREAAQLIAADELDMLIELGGTTAHSRPGVMAYRPAPLQASWLGYPHSLGLAAIDHFVADAFVAPPAQEFLLEAPLRLPNGWICMAPAAFQPQPAEDPVPPVERTGRITFGTANDPYKFSPRLLRAWARIVAAVPDSRFMIVRPEAGAPCFRENVARYFAEEGVAADRLDFRPVRGGVRPVYAEMDIALDTFPVTGGTTTCEALWMGVPTVTLVGPAPFERLSWSILSNAGLGDLAATTVEDYARIAVDLAQAPERIAELRRTMRTRIADQPLGQPARFAADFYQAIAEAIAARGRA